MNNIKNYLFGIFCVTLLTLGIWMLILFNYSPYQADTLTMSSFFVSLLIWLTGLLSLITFYAKVALSNKEVVFAHLIPTIRQSLLVSLVAVGLLVFQTLRVLTWWDVILLIISIILLELFFRTKK